MAEDMVDDKIDPSFPIANPTLPSESSSSSSGVATTISGFIERKFKKGTLTGRETAEAMATVLPSQDPNNLGTAGKSGPPAKNAHRNVLRRISKTSIHAKEYSTKITMWDELNGCQIQEDTHFILPYEEVDALFQDTDPRELCSATPGSALEARLNDWKSTQKVVDDAVAGVGVWGDMAPFNTRDSIAILLFNILTGLHHQRLAICAIAKRSVCRCGCKGRCTYEDVFRVMGWALTQWKLQVYPTIRDDGVPFAASSKIGDDVRAAKGKSKTRMKIKGGVLQKRADWQWHKAVLNMCGWRYEGPDRNICYKCNATVGGDTPYTDPSMSARWRSTMRDSTRLFIFLALLQGSFVSCIFGGAWPGFEYSMIDIDLMHCGDLGVVLYMLGNCLWEMFCELGGTIANPNEALSTLITMIKAASKVLEQDQPPVNTLTVGMMKAQGPKSPKLKCKAAEARRMLAVVHFILSNWLKPANDYSRLRLDCLTWLHRFYRELENWQRGISNTRVAEYARKHLVLYLELGQIHLDKKDWQSSGWIAYRWFPKHHLFQHLAEGALAIADNPRDHWTYGDESFIGEMVCLAESVGPKVIHRSVITKYRL